VGWAECLSVARLQEELKNLVACDLSSIGPALKRAFDVLNQHRLQYGYDTYGQVLHNPTNVASSHRLH
jgi:hypothetical protein